MKFTTDYVRCDLCGRFSNKSVTEKSPPHKVDETNICVPCVETAVEVTARTEADTLTDGTLEEEKS